MLLFERCTQTIASVDQVCDAFHFYNIEQNMLFVEAQSTDLVCMQVMYTCTGALTDKLHSKRNLALIRCIFSTNSILK